MMMKHDEIKQKLFALIDGPLSEQERALVEEHIPSCRECAKALEEWQKISGVLFSLPAFSEAAEDQFVSKVMARLSPAFGLQTPAAPSRWNILQWLVPLAGSAVAAAWVFFSVLPGTPGLSSTASAENYFSDNDSSYSASQSGIVPASATEDMVVALIK
jgi:anti-sigma factor RsiW